MSNEKNNQPKTEKKPLKDERGRVQHDYVEKSDKRDTVIVDSVKPPPIPPKQNR